MLESDIRTVQLLQSYLGGEQRREKVFAGFDGYVDTLIHVVNYRIDSDNYIRIRTIREYGEKIVAAAGLSTTIEHVELFKKYGGNGPAFSKALMDLDQEITYMGTVGRPVHPVFQELKERARVISLADEPAFTDALQFDDGKVIVYSNGKTFDNVNVKNICDVVGRERFFQILRENHLIGFLDWTVLPQMKGVLSWIIDEVLPSFDPEKVLFFDLIDPQSRTPEDLREVLEQIRAFGGRCRAILSMNVKEARLIGKSLGSNYDGDDLKRLGSEVCNRLPVIALVHSRHEVSCVSCNSYDHLNVAYCEHPKLSTGSGDNFNAGFAYGYVQGWPAGVCLAMGCSTSGFYIRNCRSPKLEEVKQFVQSWLDGTLDAEI